MDILIDKNSRAVIASGININQENYGTRVDSLFYSCCNESNTEIERSLNIEIPQNITDYKFVDGQFVAL